jgi:hypothetical protein
MRPGILLYIEQTDSRYSASSSSVIEMTLSGLKAVKDLYI